MARAGLGRGGHSASEEVAHGPPWTRRPTPVRVFLRDFDMPSAPGLHRNDARRLAVGHARDSLPFAEPSFDEEC
jgi:hypothetical protein